MLGPPQVVLEYLWTIRLVQILVVWIYLSLVILIPLSFRWRVPFAEKVLVSVSIPPALFLLVASLSEITSPIWVFTAR